MLRLDRNHSSPRTAPNLILPDTPQPDQSSAALLTWPVPPTDDPASIPDAASTIDSAQSLPPPDTPPTPPPDPPQPPQDVPAPSAASTATAQSASPSVAPTPASSTTATAPPPPAQADEPKPEQHAPSSPVDPTSPALESTSSLTPPPDSTSPAFPSVALPDGEPSAQPALEQPEPEQQKTNPEEKLTEVDKASRASTPLSELSSAPDGDDPPEAGKEEGKGDVASGAAQDSTVSKSAAEASSTEAKVEVDVIVNKNRRTERSQPKPTSEAVSLSHPNARETHPIPKQEGHSELDPQAHHLATPEPQLTIPSARIPSKLDPRVVAVLELNAHLLKVSMEFQARNVSYNEPLFQQYAQRLQSNLAWLAATADATRKVNHGAMPLPVMQPPPTVEFVAMERIAQLYSELPNLFAKDMMRRQSYTGANAAAHGPGATNGHLKRERPEEPPGDLANKRRDTGDSKVPTPGPGTPSNHHSPTHPVMNPLEHPATPPHAGPMSGVPTPSSLGSPAMPPPSMTHSMHPNDAQAAAMMAQRARMRAAGAPDANRSVPVPPIASSSQAGAAGMGMQNMGAGPSGLSNAQAGGMGGSAMLHNLQILQNPNHPVTQYLLGQVPGFANLPLNQQLQHLTRVQMILQARNQAKAMSAAGAGGLGGMQQQHHGGHGNMNAMQGGGGFQQVPGAGPQNGGMSMQGGAQMGMSTMPNGSPTRLSSAQQSPMPPQASFPFPNQGGVDPRTGAMGGGGGGSSGGLPLDPQRRQLLLMQQQQQMMRNNAMLNAQQQQQQRLAAQQAAGMGMGAGMGGSPHMGGGSPMLGGGVGVGMAGQGDAGNFPALRSNPSAVQGIARSTRTPSDHAPSPLTPQLSGGGGGGGQDLQRAMMQQQQQQAQRGMMHGMNQMGGMGGMSGINPSWPQTQQQQQQQAQQAGGYGMSPPGSAGFGSMPGSASSPSASAGGQQWPSPAGGQFAYNTGSPSAGPQQSRQGSVDGGMGPVSRQTSATPGPLQQQQHMAAQNNAMGDQASLGVDFDMFNWGQ